MGAVSPTTRRPRLLIASTTEALDYARALQSLLAPDIDAAVWDEGLFEPGEFSLESLEEHSGEFDGALVMATADDRVIARKKQFNAPRDNVVFEFGLFVAIFGRKRALLLVEAGQDIKAPTDIAGLTGVPFSKTDPIEDGLEPAAKRLKTLAPRWRDAPLDRELQDRIEALLRLSINDIQDRSGIASEFGLHVFLIDKRTDPPQLVRVARQRLGPKSPKPRSFANGQGVVGTSWRREESVFADLTEGPLRHATEAEWMALDERARLGMDYELLSASRGRYRAVGAVPITSFRPESGYMGCVAYNLGRGSTVDPAVLQSPAVVRVLDSCAETMAIILGR